MPDKIKTTEDVSKETRERALQALRSVGFAEKNELSVTAGIRKHSQSYTIMPETSTYQKEAQKFARAADEEKQMESFSRVFYYRPWDGANAVANALSDVFGYPGFAQARETFFGPVPPQKMTINVGPNETIDVPWGDLAVPDLQATFSLGSITEDLYGEVFLLSALAPAKMKPEITGFFAIVERELEENSIYNGQAIVGYKKPEFLDLSDVDRAKVIFRRDVEVQLDTELFLPTLFPDLFVHTGDNGRTVALLKGDFGGGKTTTLRLIAKYAMLAGATYLMGRAGQDDFKSMLEFATLLAKGGKRVFMIYEDIEVLGDPSQNASEKIRALLDDVDGVRSKNSTVSMLFTTNHPSALGKGVIRRMTSFVELGDFDAEALGKLFVSVIPSEKLGEIVNEGSHSQTIPHVVDDNLIGQVDFDVVYEACEGFTPFYMRKVAVDAEKYAIARALHHLAREHGVVLRDINSKADLEHARQVLPHSTRSVQYILDTQDFVIAAKSVAAQLDLQKEAKGRVEPPTVDSAIKRVVSNELTSTFLELNGSEFPLIQKG